MLSAFYTLLRQKLFCSLLLIRFTQSISFHCFHVGFGKKVETSFPWEEAGSSHISIRCKLTRKFSQDECFCISLHFFFWFFSEEYYDRKAVMNTTTKPNGKKYFCGTATDLLFFLCSFQLVTRPGAVRADYWQKYYLPYRFK